MRYTLVAAEAHAEHCDDQTADVIRCMCEEVRRVRAKNRTVRAHADFLERNNKSLARLLCEARDELRTIKKGVRME